MRIITVLIAGVFLCCVAHAQDDLFSFEFEEIAENVWVGVRPDSPRFPVMGNTMFVISDAGVVVFDGGGVSGMADQIIDKVRSLTTKPVTHVVISHWHGDHNFGVHRFAEEFADVQFVAHRFTADMMNSPRIAYIDRSSTLIERNRELFETAVATGQDLDGEAVSESDRKFYAHVMENADVINAAYQPIRVTPPNVIMDDELTIKSGERIIELRHLGHANTAGDIVMWLPDERIVATGDIVVLPAPYAFNVPPRAWAETLRNVNGLDYRILVPGHGPIQTDTSYVDLIIEVADSVADQRDAMLADGMSTDDIGAALDFSAFEERFTGGDDYIQISYDAWFEGPFRLAAMKALTGEPMVAIERAEVIPFDDEGWQIHAAESERLIYLGQSALKLQGGSAILADTEIKNGIIEFDVAVSGERGFAGLMFRVQDAKNFEHFYIRPHQSGNPDANQYTPVFNGLSAWQLYHGPGYGAPVEYRFDEWMHVRVIYAGSGAEVYIDSEEPVLRINNLKRDEIAGSIGLFDAVVLPLEAGENEVLIAVSEAFGGWGVMAEFADLEGIEIRRD